MLELADPDLTGLVFESGNYACGAGECDNLKGLEGFKEPVWYIRFEDWQPEVNRKPRKERLDYSRHYATEFFANWAKVRSIFLRSCTG